MNKQEAFPETEFILIYKFLKHILPNVDRWKLL